VTEVIFSKRLEDSPACIVGADGNMSSTMQRILQNPNKDFSIS